MTAPAYVVETRGHQPRTPLGRTVCDRCGAKLDATVHPAVALIDHATYPGRCKPGRLHLELVQ